MRNCFVPYCDAQCKNLTKRMMFLAPKDEETFLKWKERLPESKRQFKKQDKICERHFEKDDIVQHWEHCINGVMCKVERSKPKLKSTAIPQFYLDIPNELVGLKGKKKRKALKKINGSPVPNKITKNDEYINENNKIEIVLIQPNEESISSDNLIKFDNLYDDIFEVTLPNTLWGIHRDPERKYLSFSYFDIKIFQASKVYIIYNNLKTEFYIRNKLIISTPLESIEPEYLTETIENFDKTNLNDEE